MSTTLTQLVLDLKDQVAKLWYEVNNIKQMRGIHQEQIDQLLERVNQLEKRPVPRGRPRQNGQEKTVG